jgi:hypothetical protein
MHNMPTIVIGRYRVTPRAEVLAGGKWAPIVKVFGANVAAIAAQRAPTQGSMTPVKRPLTLRVSWQSQVRGFLRDGGLTRQFCVVALRGRSA